MTNDIKSIVGDGFMGQVYSRMQKADAASKTAEQHVDLVEVVNILREIAWGYTYPLGYKKRLHTREIQEKVRRFLLDAGVTNWRPSSIPIDFVKED